MSFPCYYRDSFCKIYLHNKEISYGYDIFSFFLLLQSERGWPGSWVAVVETNVYSGWIREWMHNNNCIAISIGLNQVFYSGHSVRQRKALDVIRCHI